MDSPELANPTAMILTVVRRGLYWWFENCQGFLPVKESVLKLKEIDSKHHIQMKNDVYRKNVRTNISRPRLGAVRFVRVNGLRKNNHNRRCNGSKNLRSLLKAIWRRIFWHQFPPTCLIGGGLSGNWNGSRLDQLYQGVFYDSFTLGKTGLLMKQPTNKFQTLGSHNFAVASLNMWRFFRPYTCVMQINRECGYMARVPEYQLDTLYKPEWHLPHHTVTNPNKPGKFPVISDCTHSSGNRSPNNKVLQGPDTMTNLVSVLLM